MHLLTLCSRVVLQNSYLFIRDDFFYQFKICCKSVHDSKFFYSLSVDVRDFWYYLFTTFPYLQILWSNNLFLNVRQVSSHRKIFTFLLNIQKSFVSLKILSMWLTIIIKHFKHLKRFSWRYLNFRNLRLMGCYIFKFVMIMALQ